MMLFLELDCCARPYYLLGGQQKSALYVLLLFISNCTGFVLDLFILLLLFSPKGRLRRNGSEYINFKGEDDLFLMRQRKDYYEQQNCQFSWFNDVAINEMFGLLPSPHKQHLVNH